MPYYEYKAKWDKENTTQFKIKLGNNTDAVLIDFLKNIRNRQGYIKRLVLADMERMSSEAEKTITVYKRTNDTLEDTGISWQNVKPIDARPEVVKLDVTDALEKPSDPENYVIRVTDNVTGETVEYTLK